MAQCRPELRNQRDVLLEAIKSFDPATSDSGYAFVNGEVGSGKTTFVRDVLADCAIDYICFRGGETKGKDIAACIRQGNLARHSVLSMMQGKPRILVVWVDDITAMLSGDKPGITLLARMIRPPRASGPQQSNYIIFSGRSTEDKKIEELTKGCLRITLPCVNKTKPTDRTPVDGIRYMQNRILATHLLAGRPKTQTLMSFSGADKNLVGLIWHENLGASLDSRKSTGKRDFYLRCLGGLCCGDRIDKQVLRRKCIVNCSVLLAAKCCLPESSADHLTAANNRELAFTKALTKYSTHHNNRLFIGQMCQTTGLRMKQILTTCALDAGVDQLIGSKKDRERLKRFVSKSCTS